MIMRLKSLTEMVLGNELARLDVLGQGLNIAFSELMKFITINCILIYDTLYVVPDQVLVL